MKSDVLAAVAAVVIALPRVVKRLVVLILDAAMCILAVALAYYLRLGDLVPLDGPMTLAAVVSIVIALPLFVAHGLYRAIFRYTGWPALLAVARAVGIYAVLYACVFTIYGFDDIPRTIGLIQPMLLLMLVGGSRAFARMWLGGLYQSRIRAALLPRVLVYGAGHSGRQLAAGMSNSHAMRVVGFLDDDKRLHGHVLNGQPVYDPAELETLINTRGVTDVLLAMPSTTRQRRNQIIARMRLAKVSVRTLPSITELAQGKVAISDLRELDIDDLLGREPVAPDMSLLARNITGRAVLVTGAGGSIGSELSRQAAELDPSALLLLDQSEYALYAIHQELITRASSLGKPLKLVPLLGSVGDPRRMREIMSTWTPDTVYHAAAYKHVPLVEHNPCEGVRNNVMGTLIAAQAAIENGVSDFVLISTDKAVRPTNIMGASKRLAEMVLQALASESSNTLFTMVRFGNVLGSSGSVVPKFRQQIRDGGPITLTHPEITRYFMTIPEAAQLVIQAGAMAKGGDVFVLDMGEPVRIIDLAKRMVELSGLTVQDQGNPEGDIAIEITGLRPGEKLFEELLIGQNPEGTSHPRIMRAHEEFLPWADLDTRLGDIAVHLQRNDVPALRDALMELVAGYTPADDIVDWVQLEQRPFSDPVRSAPADPACGA